MIFSINRIEKLFKKFCTEQEPNYLRTYKVGNFLDAISEKKTQYPIAVVDFLDGNFDKLQTNISIVVTIGDRVLNDESNVYEVFSNNLQVGRDLYTFLNQYKEQFAITSASYRRFLEKSGDMLAGYVFTFQLKILDVECAYEVPIVELECLDAHLTINEIPTLTLVSGETKSISVTLDGTPSGTYNALTDTWEVVSEPCPPSEITFTFDNNLIAVVDTSPYNIDCSTYLNVAIVTGSGLDGNYMVNVLNQYVLDNIDEYRILYDNIEGYWVLLDMSGILLARANTGNEPYPWLATWSTITVEEGTIANYCGGGVCADATYDIKDSANTTLYSGSIVSGGNLDQTITDSVAVLKDTDGNTLSTTNILAEGSENITAPDGAVTVNSSAFGNVKSNGSLDVPVEYENGTPVGSIISGVVQVPNPIVPSGIAYQRPYSTGLQQPFRNGDDWWVKQNRPAPSNPTNPLYIQELDFTAINYFTSLIYNNIHGNKDRFTDRLGGQTYSVRIVQDHLTGLEYPLDDNGSDIDWNGAIDYALASTLGGDNDWFATCESKLNVILNKNLSVCLNYAPFNLSANVNYFTSTTSVRTTTNALIHGNNTSTNYMIGSPKTTSTNRRVMICRWFA
jgi:hypothetical protein